MSATKMPIGVGVLFAVVVVLSLVSIGTGVYEFRKSFRDRAMAVAASQEFEAIQERLRDLSRSAAVADKTVANLQKDLDRLTSATAVADSGVPANANAAAPKPVAAESRSDWEGLQATFPEVRDMLAQIHRSQIQRSYGLFLQQAGLTPAQVDQFVNATVELYDQTEVMSLRGFHPTASQLPDSQLREILGDQGFQQIQNYNRMMPANFLAVSVEASAGYAGAPLSIDEERQLAQIVADNSPEYKNGRRMNVTTVDWENAETAARSLLSPTQWKSAEGVFLNYQFQTALAQAQKASSANPAAGALGK